MTDTVFQEDGADQPTQQESAFNAADKPTDSYVEQLVGDGKKYASVEVLAKSRVDADAHISKLEAELAELRNNYTEARSREEILEELKALTSNQSTRETARDVTTDEPQAHRTVGKEEDVEALIEQMLQGREEAKQAERNEKLCSDKLRERYGENAEKVLIEKAKELGVSIQTLRDDAATSPKKLLALFGIDVKQLGQKATVASTTTNVNTDTETFRTGGAPTYGSKAYFEKLRKENPRQYWKPETQAAILKAHADGLYVQKQ